MRIAVCMKQVPDISVKGSYDKKYTIDRNKGAFITNPADEIALETALFIAENVLAEISVFTMGSTRAEQLLKDACALGADKFYLISDPLFAGSDTYATSHILSTALRKYGPFDCVLCGRRTLDGETGQVSGGISVMLDMPLVTNVVGIEAIKHDSIICSRFLEDRDEIIEVPLPSVMAVMEGMSGITHPRLPSILGLRKALSVPIELLNCKSLELTENEVGLTGSYTKVKNTFFPDWSRKCVFFSDVYDGVSQIIELIKKTNDI